MSHRPLHLTALMLAMVQLACQGSSAPVATSAERSPIGPSLAREAQGLLSAQRVTFDPVSGLADMHPIRQGQAGAQDVLEVVDITQYFTMSPCSGCLKIVGVGTSAAGRPTLAISVRHAFSSPAPGPQMRRDLSVFNVEGLIRFAEAGQTVTNFPATGVSAVTSVRLANADGYSSALDGAYDADYGATAASIHPYRLFFRDYTTGTFSAASPQGFPDYNDIRGYLAMGQGKGPDVQVFEFDTGGRPGLITFDLILQSSFGVSSASLAERTAPEYRLPQFNKKSASEVILGVSDAVPGNLSGRGLLSGISPSAAQVRIQVMDITDVSTGATVGASRDQLRAASDVAQLRLEIPSVLTSAITINSPGTMFEGGSGNDPIQPLTYAIGITNQASATTGTYFGLVRIGDSYPLDANTILPEDAQRLSTPGFTTPYALSEIATYQVFPLEVKPNSIQSMSDAAIGDAYGTSLATGDFNADGQLDLAVGAFEADPGAVSNAGQVLVYYGLPGGFFPAPLTLTEPAPAINVRFGFQVAIGDVTGDGRDDLLASATNPNIAGRIQLFRSTGTSFLPALTLQDLTLVAGSRFGWSIALADIDGDGKQDAFIGASEALGSFLREGAFYRYFGNPGGLTSPLRVSTVDPQLDALFGTGLAVLHNPTGTPSALAVGMPGYNGGIGRVYHYAITSIGSLAAPTAIDPVGGMLEDGFGYALAAADFTFDGLEDLVIGAPGSATSMTGRIELFVQLPGDLFTPVSTFTAGGFDTYSFGSTLTTGDFDGDGRRDIAGGGLLLTASAVPTAGKVAIFPSGRQLAANVLEFHAVSATPSQRFGRVVLAVPRPGSPDQLLVGAPGDDPSGNTDAGSVFFY